MLVCFFGHSCGSPKFYNEIKSLYKEENNDERDNIDSNTLFIYNTKDTNIDKLFLKSVEDDIKHTNHIIYFYVPDNSIPIQKYYGVIYDVDHTLYYILAYEKSNKNVVLKTISDSLNDEYYKFVFENYLNNNCHYLKELGELSDHSGVRTYQAIYEVNKKDNKINKCVFRDIFFTYYIKE